MVSCTLYFTARLHTDGTFEKVEAVRGHGDPGRQFRAAGFPNDQFAESKPGEITAGATSIVAAPQMRWPYPEVACPLA